LLLQVVFLDKGPLRDKAERQKDRNNFKRKNKLLVKRKLGSVRYFKLYFWISVTSSTIYKQEFPSVRQNVTMQEIRITPAVRPFIHPSGNATYYCNQCESYSNDFYRSAIKSEYRRCRRCHRRKVEERASQRTKLEKLVKKLKYNFIYQQRRDLAKGVRTQHVLQVLKAHGIVYESQLDLVKTIVPNYDLVNKSWRLKVVYRSGSG